MKSRSVVFSPAARDDIFALYDFIASAASPDVAYKYMQRLQTFCQNLELASERGSVHDDVRPGLRTIGFERRLTIAFTVDVDFVTILGVHAKGRNWTAE